MTQMEKGPKWQEVRDAGKYVFKNVHSRLEMLIREGVSVKTGVQYNITPTENVKLDTRGCNKMVEEERAKGTWLLPMSGGQSRALRMTMAREFYRGEYTDRYVVVTVVPARGSLFDRDSAHYRGFQGQQDYQVLADFLEKVTWENTYNNLNRGRGELYGVFSDAELHTFGKAIRENATSSADVVRLVEAMEKVAATRV